MRFLRPRNFPNPGEWVEVFEPLFDTRGNPKSYWPFQEVDVVERDGSVWLKSHNGKVWVQSIKPKYYRPIVLREPDD